MRRVLGVVLCFPARIRNEQHAVQKVRLPLIRDRPHHGCHTHRVPTCGARQRACQHSDRAVTHLYAFVPYPYRILLLGLTPPRVPRIPKCQSASKVLPKCLPTNKSVTLTATDSCIRDIAILFFLSSSLLVFYTSLLTFYRMLSEVTQVTAQRTSTTGSNLSS